MEYIWIIVGYIGRKNLMAKLTAINGDINVALICGKFKAINGALKMTRRTTCRNDIFVVSLRRQTLYCLFGTDFVAQTIQKKGTLLWTRTRPQRSRPLLPTNPKE